MSITLNFERLVRFFQSAKQMAFKYDLKPMGALFVKDNQVVVCVDNEVSDEQFIECLEALVKQYKNRKPKHN
jgi:hypothetical protein